MSQSEISSHLTVPDGFPVIWTDPALAEMHWSWDQMHYPYPLTPLTATFESPAFCEGTSIGFNAIGLPMRMRQIIVNGYCYNSDGQQDDVPPLDENEIARRLPGLTDAWEREFLPEIEEINRRLRDHDYASLSNAELLAFVDEAYRMRVRSWDIHMQVVIPVMGIASRFADLYENMIGKPEQGEPYQMLQGFPNMTVESGKALWALSRRALTGETVAEVLLNTPVSEIPQALQRSAAGAAFWAEFQDYLDQYGCRSDAFELADPAWAEDPAIPLEQLRDMLRSPDAGGPDIQEERSRKERERLVAETFERLNGNEGRPLFETMLALAQQYLPLQENHNFYIDQMNTGLLRRPFLEIGARLAELGAIEQRDDVFYLERGELAPALERATSRDWRALITHRRADREHWSSVVPPRDLGSPPSPDENPIGIAFFGRRPERSADPRIINGTAASPGTVTGTARVIRSLGEASKLEPGDVLVCQMTLPAWTPLFATVSAVVADSGGVLSHCAIVAREYRMPCVVGTHIGTQTLKDGQRITVDGTQRLVRIES